MLRPDDIAVLDARNLTYTATAENGFVCLVLQAYPLPVGADRPATDVLVRLPAGFPDTAPDMFWCSDDVKFASTGASAPAANTVEPYLGRTWWRWSRHIQNGWQPGDDLRTYLRYIDRCFAHAASQAAA